ncbi:hypothetical protein A5731_02225 [Mycolicibacterium conceptionense]|uniref:Uncharacterized protein n=1 Tax=Mycolicibacterium conceptionense TaxID=451644 RepID=A0A1A2V651_9MYCO|nr:MULTISPECIES: hypothetical protein [Mycolicibacterium]MCW1821687.1 hypothetical protein [Mycolicibacterium senegalense]OBB10165.1 hypothetical protein A5718_09735 [Mycolicibacterium conceptionense]OBF08882.1 hypothetical protein A5731_02225 [Mycolicibacterium conceptionense]OBF25774.1 hypothetical protein A5726_07130 [Mycolicibacterium conceptionense]OBF43455.1 hypothetical protein A5720_12575 [Mycolicibacterium conceptionense]
MPNDYTRAERTQLASALGCKPEQLDERLSGFAAAAEEEYVRMMLGQHVYSRGQDIKVYRLSLLIKHAFEGRLPTEGQISALFQTTTTESRSLLRAVRAKFQYELRKATHDTMGDVFGRATKDDDADTWSLVCDSENVIEALNDTVARHDGSLPKIRKAPGTAGEYAIAASTHAALAAIL